MANAVILHRFRAWFLVALFKGVIFSGSAVANYPDYWDRSAYANECKNDSLAEVMQDFATSFGLLLKMDKNVGGLCQGWVRAENAVFFLDSLSYKYQFEWFVFRQTLYISSISDNETLRLKVDPNLKIALRDLGLYQEKFGWGDIELLDVALISGPPSYLKLIKQLLNKTKDEQDETTETTENIYVIPVIHSSVYDHTTKVRGNDVTVPGIATILSKVLEDLDTSDDSVSKDTPLVNKKASKLLKDSKNKAISVQADIRTNSLVIKSTGKKFNREFFEKLIKQLDREQKMIEIDAIIVDINKEKLSEIGVKSFKTNNSELDFSFELPQAQSISGSESTFLLTNPAEFIANLKLLEGHGDASIIANTSILTMENLTAVIDLSETQFIQTVGERVANLEQLTTGTLLNVVPQHISTAQGDRIKLVVEIEDGKFEGGSTLPRIVKSNINTTAVISQNQALVIGGYHVEKRAENLNKIPFFGDIPLLGHLFSLRSEKHVQRERIFILTPRESRAQHRAESYSYFGQGKLIAENVQKIQQRWYRANQNYVDLFVEQVQQYLKYQTINDFDASTITKVPFECKAQGVEFEFEGLEQFSGEGIDIFVGKVTKTSKRPQTVHEKACFGRGLIGVSFMDGDRILHQEGDQSRVLVAIETAKLNPISKLGVR